MLRANSNRHFRARLSCVLSPGFAMIANQPSPRQPLAYPSLSPILSRVALAHERPRASFHLGDEPREAPLRRRLRRRVPPRASRRRRADFPPPRARTPPSASPSVPPSPRPRPREPASLAAAGTAPPLPPFPVPPARKTPRRDVRRRRRTPRPPTPSSRDATRESLRTSPRTRSRTRVPSGTSRDEAPRDVPSRDDGSPRRARASGWTPATRSGRRRQRRVRRARHRRERGARLERRVHDRDVVRVESRESGLVVKPRDESRANR